MPYRSERDTEAHASAIGLEMATRHADVVAAVYGFSPVLMRRLLDEFTLAPLETLPQVCGRMALMFRYHVEIASYESPGALRGAVAALDALADRYPAGQRISKNFTFRIAGDTEEFGPGVLDWLAWHFQMPFVDAAGRIVAPWDPVVISDVADVMAAPKPAQFFRLVSLDTTMEAMALTLHARLGGGDARHAVRCVVVPTRHATGEQIDSLLREAMKFVDPTFVSRIADQRRVVEAA